MNQKKIINIEKHKAFFKKRPDRLKRKSKGFFFSLFLFLIIGAIFYFSSSLSRLSMIHFEGLGLVSRAEVVALMELSGDETFLRLNLRELEANVNVHPLVESASIERQGLNSLTISVIEKDIVACADVNGELMYVVSDGQVIKGSEDVNITCQGVIISGLTLDDLEASVLSRFVQALAEVDPVFVSLIKEIEYEPRFGDINRFSLFLKDGNTVKVNSYTMAHYLNFYQTQVEYVAGYFGESVTGIFNLDVGLFFEPYFRTEIINLENREVDSQDGSEDHLLDEGADASVGERVEDDNLDSLDAPRDNFLGNLEGGE